jgi:hypothetical protein
MVSNKKSDQDFHSELDLNIENFKKFKIEFIGQCTKDESQFVEVGRFRVKSDKRKVPHILIVQDKGFQGLGV